MNDKIALVLAGGGAKGAYEVGAIKALEQLNIKFDIITGTSIGALNGCLIAQNDYQSLYKLWEDISIDKVIGGTLNLSFDFNDLINNTGIYGELIKKYINEQGVDISPLKNIIDNLYNVNNLKNSNVDFACVCVEYPSLNPVFVNKDMMIEKGKDYLISTASCFPAFPIHKFDDKSYIDGGYYDNLPINLALSMGATKFIVVDLSETIYHKNYFNRENVIYIYPKFNIGSFLDFDKNTLKRNMVIGYNDTLKMFNVYLGHKYTFEKFEIPSFMDELYVEMQKMEYMINKSNNKDNMVITDYFLKNLKKPILNKDDLFFLIIDEIFTMLKKDVEIIYTYNQLCLIILEEFKQGFDKNYEVLPSSINSLRNYLSTFDRVGIISKFINTKLYPSKKIIDENILLSISSVDLFISKFIIYMVKYILEK